MTDGDADDQHPLVGGQIELASSISGKNTAPQSVDPPRAEDLPKPKPDECPINDGDNIVTVNKYRGEEVIDGFVMIDINNVTSKIRSLRSKAEEIDDTVSEFEYKATLRDDTDIDDMIDLFADE